MKAGEISGDNIWCLICAGISLLFISFERERERERERNEFNL